MFVLQSATIGAYPGNAISRIQMKTTALSTNVETGISEDRAGSYANGGGMTSSRERQAARGPAEASESGGPSCRGGAAEESLCYETFGPK